MFEVKKTAALSVVALSLVLFFSFPFPSNAAQVRPGPKKSTAAPAPKKGGVLKIAYAADPGSLDFQKDANSAMFDIVGHIVEALFEYDSAYTLQPMLAKSHKESSDHLTHAITLRKGVLFHNDQELTADDVVASIKRQLKVTRVPLELTGHMESITAKDKYTVEVRLKEPFPEFLYSMTVGIIPRELAEKYPKTSIPDKEMMGTGPYQIKERIPDRYVELVRFDRYASRQEKTDGYVGRKYAYVDKIIFYILPDPAVRLMGAETGEYHYAYGVNHADYQRIIDNPQLDPRVTKTAASIGSMFNCKTGPSANIKVRQAILAALDAEPVMKAAYIYPQLYTLESGFLWPQTKQWYTKAGSQYYNQKNPQKAKQLLKEAGYKGETIIMLGIAEIEYLRNACMVVNNQLREIGLNVDLQLVDQNTFASRLLKGQWHIVTAVSGFVPMPSLFYWTREKEPITGWTSEKKLRLAVQMRKETSQAKRFKAWEEMQALAYEEAARTKYGNGSSLAATTIKAAGWGEMTGVRFWNVWFK
ncbi:MAG: hypothetical protein JW943_07605 [Deltaproteobacteria bacterium]|nr:hypothetical protein [Deltaproteobacteria bacterium]